MMIQNRRCNRFDATVCGVQSHGKHSTPHTHKYSDFRWEILQTLEQFPSVFPSPCFLIGYTSSSTGCMLVCPQGKPNMVGYRGKTIQHVEYTRFKVKVVLLS
ncbi:hypothetical protein AMECASPLE_016988 [Ameca splendens]|uniref:Uncharacterized protein n=1 Tax=Ameca splendens TaxID=208324 RepID=A0ABV0XFD9_9TELE